jgi:hypothetical protein
MNDNFVHLPRCPGTVEIPSREEKECLGQMKAIKERVRDLKALAKSMEGSSENDRGEMLQKVETELRNLKRQWDDWEKKRLKAEKERMILLGHLEADDT